MRQLLITKSCRIFFILSIVKHQFMIRNICSWFFFLLLVSCNSSDALLELHVLDTPCKIGGEPNLYKSNTGNLYLSWIEYENDSLSVLKFAKWEENKWSDAREVSRGTDWFVNWADFPAMAVSGKDDMHLAAHWLAKSDAGTFDYDVVLSQSFDGGETWLAGEVVHKDSIHAEHGFVSIQSMGEDGFAMCWLDGRNTKSEDHAVSDDHGHGHHGSMSLRYTEINSKGEIAPSVELDNKVCDCCQTDMVIAEVGPIVVYRDRSDAEIRDIYVSRSVDKTWYEPKTVFQDNWEIAGCPVNGPAVALEGERMIVFWYTMNTDGPVLKYVRSENQGETFSEAISLDIEQPIGRLDVKFIDSDHAILVWMENESKDGALIKSGIVNFDRGLIQTNTLVRTGNSRNSGFPRIETKDRQLFVVWTNTVTEEQEFVESAIFDLNF